MKPTRTCRRALAVLLVVLTMLTQTCALALASEVRTNSIENWPKGPEISCATAVVYDADTKAVLYDKGMDTVRFPASTTKIMTALLAIENLAPDAIIRIGEHAASQAVFGSTNIGGRVGEDFTRDQALHAILLASANEVSTQVAEAISGSVEAFADLMNQRAAELGCTNTHFHNANGLPDEEHWTSAHDLALIMAECIKNETFCQVEADLSYTIPPTNATATSRSFQQHHVMMLNGEWHYEGVFAGKTGYTDAAGQTLVTACKINDHTLICVVMGGTNPTYFTETKLLLNYAYENFSLEEVNDVDGWPISCKVSLPTDRTLDDLELKEVEVSSPGDEDRTFERSYTLGGNVLGSARYSIPASEFEKQNTSALDGITSAPFSGLGDKDSSKTLDRVLAFLLALIKGFKKIVDITVQFCIGVYEEIKAGNSTSPILIVLGVDLIALLLLIIALIQKNRQKKKRKAQRAAEAKKRKAEKLAAERAETVPYELPKAAPVTEEVPSDLPETVPVPLAEEETEAPKLSRKERKAAAKQAKKEAKLAKIKAREEAEAARIKAIEEEKAAKKRAKEDAEAAKKKAKEDAKLAKLKAKEDAKLAKQKKAPGQEELPPAAEEAVLEPIEELSVVEELPAEEVLPVEEELPVVEVLPVEEELPVVEELPVEEELSVAEELPVEEELSVAEELPIEEELLIDEDDNLPLEIELPKNQEEAAAQEEIDPIDQLFLMQDERDTPDNVLDLSFLDDFTNNDEEDDEDFSSDLIIDFPSELDDDRSQRRSDNTNLILNPFDSEDEDKDFLIPDIVFDDEE